MPERIGINLSSLRRMMRGGSESARRDVEPFVKAGDLVADLGCRTGYYTFALAECVGPEGRVHAVDLDSEAIAGIERAAEVRRVRNVETHACSAADLAFLKDRSVDFVLANGLLCSMPRDQEAAVGEIKRVLKAGGRAYLSLGFPPPLGHVNRAEWERILSGFHVHRRGRGWRVQWALVSGK